MDKYKILKRGHSNILKTLLSKNLNFNDCYNNIYYVNTLSDERSKIFAKRKDF